MTMLVGVTTLLVAAPSAPARAHNGPFGLGLVLGSPTALSGKYWLNTRAAVDFGLGFGFNDYMLVYADYLYHYPGAFGRKDAFVANLIPYFGVGGIIVLTTSDRRDSDTYLGRRSGSLGLGVRVPFGLEWRPGDPSLGIFVEIAPGISVIPNTQGIIQAGIGIRYYF